LATVPSSKLEGTSAAAEQLGSMSLGGSAVERKNNETKPTAKNGTNPTKKLCSACGKESDALKKCNGCKCVWYCDKDCQNKHRKEHKKECKRIKKILEKRGGRLDVGTEKDVGPIGKLPPQEECPICMHVLPIHPKVRIYAFCCGKTLCGGCEYQHQMKNGDMTDRGQTPCAFCREPISDSNEESLARLRQRAEHKDPKAVCHMALIHDRGLYGLPVNQAKCIELLLVSADLGFPGAQFELGQFHHEGRTGLEQNEEEAIKYWKKAAEGGHLRAQHNLGCVVESKNRDYAIAMDHWRLSATGGFRPSVDSLLICFEHGLLHHGDLAETLQAFYLARAGMKSKGRDEYIAHLKTTGEYKQEYEL
jgi:hypothetical protein